MLTYGLHACQPRHQLSDALPYLLLVHPKIYKHLHSHTFTLVLSHESQQDVLGTDVGVTEAEGFAQRQRQDPLDVIYGGRRVEGGHVMPTGPNLDLLPHRFKHYSEASEYPAPHPFGLSNEAEQDVFGPYGVVLEKVRFVAGEDQYLPAAVGQLLEHVSRLCLLW